MDAHRERPPASYKIPGIKPRDLIGIPWTLAFALRAKGWFLRQEIIWHKPNPMPESVINRPTRAHEQIFLLTKSKKYFYDAKAIKEPAVTANDPKAMISRNNFKRTQSKRLAGNPTHKEGTHRPNRLNSSYDPTTRSCRSVWTIPVKPVKEAHFAVYPEALIKPCVLAGTKPGDTILDPFFGAGTTGVVAQLHDRKYLGIELNPEYCSISKKRIEAIS